MRKVREILRLAISCGMGQREISRSCSVSPTTVGNYMSIACEKGLSYAEISRLSDEQLRQVFQGKKQGQKVRPQPDWEQIHRELKKKGVTLQLLWQEYKQLYPDGWQSTQIIIVGEANWMSACAKPISPAPWDIEPAWEVSKFSISAAPACLVN